MKTSTGWKRWAALGCSHGHLIDSGASKAALSFVKRWKPHTRIHLGDFTDMAAFRGGASGTADEAADIKMDLRAGLRFLEEYRPTVLLNGNHEDRLFRDMHHPNAIRAHAAQCIVNELRGLTAKMKCQYVEHYDINRSWFDLGNTRFVHGFMYGQNAIAEHAEHFGRCVLAHLHKVGAMTGRRSDHPVAYCVGTLSNVEAMAYAKMRRATAQWSHGLAYGEYNDSECKVWLAQEIDGRWNFPV